jgi:hypothetical protein
MQNDLHLQYRDSIDQSHRGHPELIELVHTGCPGCSSIHINPEFLQWAYTMQSTQSIACYLGVGHSTVCNALLEHGIA